jgi:hypothetical protein
MPHIPRTSGKSVFAAGFAPVPGVVGGIAADGGCVVGLVAVPPLLGFEDPALGVDELGVEPAGVVAEGVPVVEADGVVVGAAAVGPAAGAAPPAAPSGVGVVVKSSLQPTSS